MASLVLLAGATGTRIVAADLLPGAHKWLLRLRLCGCSLTLSIAFVRRTAKIGMLILHVGQRFVLFRRQLIGAAYAHRHQRLGDFGLDGV